MALPILSVPAFPNVPPYPGVPAIPRNPLTTAVTPVITRLVTDATIVAKLLGIQVTPTWGIWDAAGRTPVILGDSVVTTDFRAEYETTDAPVENGSFETYNRVRRPKEMVVAISKGGSAADRHGFLLTVQTALDSTVLYTVVQPEVTYPNMGVVNVSYERARDKGAQMITVDIHMREILTAAAALFTSTKDPSSAGQDNSGAVQALAPTAAQAPALDTSIPSFAVGP